MIRPPSNQKQHSAFYTGDPAIIQLPDEASEEQVKDRDERIDRARESGEWRDVISEGEAPTEFVFRPLPAKIAGELIALVEESRGRPRDLFAVFTLAFCAALIDVKHLADAGKIDFVNHATYGRIATTAFLDRAGCSGELGAAIITELGSYVLSRARAANPKS